MSGFVTIQRGCDKFCTFCVVPFTRGRERGTAPREVLRQARALVERGYKEVTLLGQTVNSYAWEDSTFAQLLRAVARVDGLERNRFTSPYPVDFTDDVIAAIAEEPKIGKYVHLPVQSGADAVLARLRPSCTASRNARASTAPGGKRGPCRPLSPALSREGSGGDAPASLAWAERLAKVSSR